MTRTIAAEEGERAACQSNGLHVLVSVRLLAAVGCVALTDWLLCGIYARQATAGKIGLPQAAAETIVPSVVVFVLWSVLGRIVLRRKPVVLLLILTAVGCLGGALWMRTAWAWIAALGMFAIAWGVGTGLWPLLRLSTDAGISRFLKTAVGLQVLSLLGLLWSMLHIWSPGLVVASGAFVGASAALLARRRRIQPSTGAREDALPPLSLPERVAASSLAGAAIILTLVASLPEIGFDELSQHLSNAQLIARNQYLPNTDIWHTLIPHGYHMLLGLSYGLGGMPAATYTHTLFGFLALLGTIAFGARLYGRSAGLAAGALLLAAPLVLHQETRTMAEFASVVYGLVLAISLYFLVAEREPGWSLLSAASIGMTPLGSHDLRRYDSGGC